MLKIGIGILWIAANAFAAPVELVSTHTATDSGFGVNSHLIQGSSDAILIDAQFTRSEAAKVVDLVKASKKRLRIIYITHGHPDHYFGLEVLKKAFPKARILASAETVAEIKATAEGKQKFWKPIYKDDLTDTIVLPAVYHAKTLPLENEQIQLISLGAGESEHATALYIPSVKTLVAGDLIFGGVHLWLAENRPENWLQNLVDIRKFNIEKVLAGHGANGDLTLLDTNESYIRAFTDSTRKPTTKAEAAAKINATYGNYRLPIILDLALDARLK